MKQPKEIDFNNFNTSDLCHNDFIEYTEGYKYQLAKTSAFKLYFRAGLVEDIETKYIKLTVDGWLIIKEGYAWDGASGPTYDSENTMRASMVHDALYQLLRMGIIEAFYRDESDQQLYVLVREDGMWYIRAKAWFNALDWFGGSAASPKSRKKIYRAGMGRKKYNLKRIKK